MQLIQVCVLFAVGRNAPVVLSSQNLTTEAGATITTEAGTALKNEV